VDSSILPPQDDGVMSCSLCTPPLVALHAVLLVSLVMLYGGLLHRRFGFHFHTATPFSASTACGGRRRQVLYHPPHHQREHYMVACHMVTSSRDRSCRRIKCGCLNSLLLPAMMLTIMMFMVGCAWRWTGFTTPSKHAKSHAMTNTSHRHGAGVQQALSGSFYQPVCAWDSLQEQNVPVGAPHTLRMFRW